MSGRAERLERLISNAIDLQHLEVVDESGNHHVPDGAESHFKVVAVAAEFAAQPRLARHRRINGLVQQEFDGGLHALAIHAYSETEWRDRFGAAPMSPPCAGGSRSSS